MATEKNVAPAEARPYRKVRRGLVVSDKMDKTITVKIEPFICRAIAVVVCIVACFRCTRIYSCVAVIAITST